MRPILFLQATIELAREWLNDRLSRFSPDFFRFVYSYINQVLLCDIIDYGQGNLRQTYVHIFVHNFGRPTRAIGELDHTNTFRREKVETHL